MTACSLPLHISAKYPCHRNFNSSSYQIHASAPHQVFVPATCREKNNDPRRMYSTSTSMYVHCCLESGLAIYISVRRMVVLPLQCLSWWWWCSGPRSVKHNTYVPNLNGLSDTVAWTVMRAWFCTGLSTSDTLRKVELGNQQARRFCTEYEVATYILADNYIDTSELDFLVPVWPPLFRSRQGWDCAAQLLPFQLYLWLINLSLNSSFMVSYLSELIELRDDNLSHIVLLGKLQRLIVLLPVNIGPKKPGS